MTQTNRNPRASGARSEPRPRNAHARPYPPKTAQAARAKAQQRSGRRPPVRNAAPRRSTGGGLWMLILGGVLVAFAALMLQNAWPNGFPLTPERGEDALERVSEIHAEGPVRINEVMSANRNCYVDAEGGSPDWIEVSNVSAGEVNLEGYTLSKAANAANTFTFPELRLAAGQSVLVLADSRLRTDAGDELHAPFRLSSAGDHLMLFNAGGTAVDTVNLPAVNPDQSYARADTALWQLCDAPTPGQPNTEEGRRALTEPVADSPVVITELMADNRSTIADADGKYCDYIELHNRSAEPVDLGGWTLSDDPDDIRRWRFPALTLEPDGYLLVYASKLDRRSDVSNLHLNFSLSSEGEQVILCDAQGRRMDRVEFGLLKADVAWSLSSGGWSSAAAPSPGKANP